MSDIDGSEILLLTSEQEQDESPAFWEPKIKKMFVQLVNMVKLAEKVYPRPLPRAVENKSHPTPEAETNKAGKTVWSSYEYGQEFVMTKVE